MNDSQVEEALPSFNDINPSGVVHSAVTNRLSPCSNGERIHFDDAPNHGAPTYQND